MHFGVCVCVCSLCDIVNRLKMPNGCETISHNLLLYARTNDMKTKKLKKEPRNYSEREGIRAMRFRYKLFLISITKSKRWGVKSNKYFFFHYY